MEKNLHLLRTGSSMASVPTDRCGYVWPEDCERVVGGDDVQQQSCCYRETVPDADRCVWHVDPDDTTHKTADNLQESRAPAAIRERNEPYDELLDGLDLSGVHLRDPLSLAGTAMRGGNLHATIMGAQFVAFEPETVPAEREPSDRFDLTGADLTRADLSGADLSGVDLVDVDLTYADLSNAVLMQADLTEASGCFADLTGVTADDARVIEAEFIGADLLSASLEDAELRGSDLTGGTLRDAAVSSADLIDVSLFGAELQRARFDRARLSNVNLSATKLGDSRFESADLDTVALDDADCTGTYFRGATLSSATLSGINLEEADLRNATLADVELRDGKLSGMEVNRATKIEPLRQPDDRTDPDSWDEIARTYHDLKRVFGEASLIEQARKLRIRERRARRIEIKADQGWFSPEHVTSYLSGLFTGYGIRVWRVVGVIVVVPLVFAVVYQLLGVDQPLRYSLSTFTTSPPVQPTNPLTRFVVNVETFAKTLLTVLLGYILGNREQF